MGEGNHQYVKTWKVETLNYLLTKYFGMELWVLSATHEVNVS